MSYPPNLAEIIFRKLYPDHELLVTPNCRYGVMCTGTLIVAESLGTLAQMISGFHNVKVQTRLAGWAGPVTLAG